MKIKVLALVSILFLIMGMGVCAASPEFDITVPEDFVAASKGDDLSAAAECIGMSVSELSSYFNKNGLIYLAVAKDNSIQIRLSAFADNFSSVASDMSYLDDNTLQEFKMALSAEGEKQAEIIENGGRKYIAVYETLTDSGGEYTVTQYVTVCGGRSYYLSCYNDGNSVSDVVKGIFNSFKLVSKADTVREYPDWLPFAIGGAAAVFAVLAFVMLFGIIKAAKNKEN